MIHIYVMEFAITVSRNFLVPVRRFAIKWTSYDSHLYLKEQVSIKSERKYYDFVHWMPFNISSVDVGHFVQTLMCLYLVYIKLLRYSTYIYTYYVYVVWDVCSEIMVMFGTEYIDFCHAVMIKYCFIIFIFGIMVSWHLC